MVHSVVTTVRWKCSPGWRWMESWTACYWDVSKKLS